MSDVEWGRNAEILEATINGEPYEEEPQSRIEELLLELKQVIEQGGGASSPLWCQMKADMTGKRLVTLKNKETACLGTAILAGVGAGIFTDVQSACDAIIDTDKVYEPKGDDYTASYKQFCEAEAKIL